MKLHACFAVLAVALGWQTPSPPTQAKLPDFSGTWTLNSTLSDNPAEANFDPPRGNQGRGGLNGGMSGLGRRGGFGGQNGGSRNRSGSDEAAPTAEEKANLSALIDELKRGSAKLTIAHHDPSLTITDALAHVMFFQTTASRDPHTFGTATVSSTSHWEGDHIVVEFAVSSRRALIFTYALLQKTNQLVLRVSPAFSDAPASNAVELKLVYERS